MEKSSEDTNIGEAFSNIESARFQLILFGLLGISIVYTLTNIFVYNNTFLMNFFNCLKTTKIAKNIGKNPIFYSKTLINDVNDPLGNNSLPSLLEAVFLFY